MKYWRVYYKKKMAAKKSSLLIQAPIPSKATQSRVLPSVLDKSAAPINPENYNCFQVRAPKNINKRHSVMKFNTKVDISSITTAHMQRQKKVVEVEEDDMPKFGAGSEYGRDQRIEARLKKKGYVKKITKDEDLPWLLKTGGRGGKKYKGVKEANISQNAAYYIFSQCADGSFEAHPVDSFYRFTPIINYRTLTADEAEEEFSLRNKTINYFSLMVKKRLVDPDSVEKSNEDQEMVVQKVKSKVDKLQLYNDDDLGDMSNDEGDDDEEHADEEKFQKAKTKLKKPKKSSNDEDNNVAGEMEDGHFDSKEVDYMSDSSSSEEEEIKEKERESRPEAEDDLNAQLNPDSEDDSELEDDKLSKGGLLLKDMLRQNSDSSGDEDEEEMDEEQTKSAVLLQGQKKKGKKTGSNSTTSSSSRSVTPTKGLETTDKTIADAAKKLKDISSPHGKKRPKSSTLDETPAKKLRKEAASPSIHRSASGSSLATRTSIGDSDSPGSRGSPVPGITEETVRRYLSHKPMTTKDLLRKFKTTKTGLSSEQTLQQIAAILKKIQPEKNQVKGKLYLSLKRS